jgi:hypothetical protein
METNWAKLKAKFQQQQFEESVYYMITGYATSANTQTELSRLENFLQEKSSELSSLNTDLNMKLKTAKLNMELTKDSNSSVSNWLKSQVEIFGPEILGKYCELIKSYLKFQSIVNK